MKHRQTCSHRPVRNLAYREAFQRLDGALEENTSVSHAERTQLIGRQMFGDLWDEPKEDRTVGNPE